MLGLNVVIDDERRLAFVSYGDIVASHESAVEYVRQYAVVPVSGTAYLHLPHSSTQTTQAATTTQSLQHVTSCLNIETLA